MLYKVMSDGWPDGVFRTKGQEIELTEAQAKWLVLSGQVEPAGAPALDETAGGSKKRKGTG